MVQKEQHVFTAEESSLTQGILQPKLKKDDLDGKVSKPYTEMHTTPKNPQMVSGLRLLFETFQGSIHKDTQPSSECWRMLAEWSRWPEQSNSVLLEVVTLRSGKV